jgi:hypothetical protein
MLVNVGLVPEERTAWGAIDHGSEYLHDNYGHFHGGKATKTHLLTVFVRTSGG